MGLFLIKERRFVFEAFVMSKFHYLFIFSFFNFIDNTQTLHIIKYIEKGEREKKKVVAKIKYITYIL